MIAFVFVLPDNSFACFLAGLTLMDPRLCKFIGRASEKPLSCQLCQRALSIVMTCGHGNSFWSFLSDFKTIGTPQRFRIVPNPSPHSLFGTIVLLMGLECIVVFPKHFPCLSRFCRFSSVRLELRSETRKCMFWRGPRKQKSLELGQTKALLKYVKDCWSMLQYNIVEHRYCKFNLNLKRY